jgi:hypothetical protein
MCTVLTDTITGCQNTKWLEEDVENKAGCQEILKDTQKKDTKRANQLNLLGVACRMVAVRLET